MNNKLRIAGWLFVIVALFLAWNTTEDFEYTLYDVGKYVMLFGALTCFSVKEYRMNRLWVSGLFGGAILWNVVDFIKLLIGTLS